MAEVGLFREVGGQKDRRAEVAEVEFLWEKRGSEGQKLDS